MLQGLRGRKPVTRAADVFPFLPSPREAGECPVPSGLFRALPRSYYRGCGQAEGPPGNCRKVISSSEGLTGQFGWSALEVGPQPRPVGTLRPTLVGWAVNKKAVGPIRDPGGPSLFTRLPTRRLLGN